MPVSYTHLDVYKRQDFNRGLKVPGKLRPKRIRGGIILVETPYEMR